jgi:hypothetical protein
LFTRYDFVPTGDIYAVNQPNPVITSAVVNISITDVEQTTSFVTTINSETLTVGSFSVSRTFQIGGPSSSDFGSNSIVFDTVSQTTYLAPAFPLNSPGCGSIGDIQSANTDNLITPNPGNPQSLFLFPTDCVNVINEGATAGFQQLRNPGIAGIGQYQTLPLTIGSTTWSRQGWQLTGDTVGQAPLQLTLNTAGALSLTVTASIVCPVVVSVNASGCFNCQTAASAVVQLTSTCSSGVCSVAADQPYILVATNAVPISTTPSFSTIFFETTQAANDFNLIVSCGHFNASIPVAFTAVAYVPVQQNNVTTTGGVGTSTSNSGGSVLGSILGWLDSVLNGTAAWWNYLVSAIVVVVVIVVLILTIPLIKSAFSGLRSLVSCGKKKTPPKQYLPLDQN